MAKSTTFGVKWASDQSFCPIVQVLQNVYQAEKDVLQVAMPVKMPRDDAWHEIEQCHWTL